jgi:hypothetical protein
MNLQDIPIGNSVTSDHGDYVTTTTRINSDFAIVDQIEKTTGNSVLKMKVHVASGDTETQHIDYNFWTIYVDGAPYDGTPVQGSVKTDLANRTMNITTN